ncbi:MAG: DPP IV N-terminal domain-containing protein [Balneolales bacterium]|nr:DPP IV N-terminal domain-containing protein [Balneolales bacterium]
MEQALFSGAGLRGGSGPQSVNWIAQGERFSYMTSVQQGISQIRTFNPGTGEDVLVFDGAEARFPNSGQAFSFRSFEWSDDAGYIVFQTRFEPVYRYSGISDYYRYSIENGTMELVAERAFTAQLSPDGNKLAYHKDGNMFVYDFSSGSARQLTFNEEDNVFYGRFGWVYEEEFGLVQAWSWSNDSRYIAFWKSDEREVPLFKTTNFEGTHPEWFEIPFPKVGDTNPTVKIGVIDTRTDQLTWMNHNAGDGYVPRIYWTANEAELAIVSMNRAQTRVEVIMFDVHEGQGVSAMSEDSDVWIDVFDFFAGIDHYFFFPKDHKSFFWISDRDGNKHLYHYDLGGNLKRQVTSGDWQITYVHAIDAENELIYFTSTEVSPLERHLYRIRFDGTDKQRLTETAGNHRINMGPDGRFFIDYFSNIETPLQVELWSTASGKLRSFETNEGVREHIQTFSYAPRELFQFTASDGKIRDGFLIRPSEFDPEKSYPLVLSVYGGPSAQGVYNQFETNMFYQYLAQQGYVVANVNNLGSGGYGRDFEKAVYLDLGASEASDFVETAIWLSANHSWIDGDRMAIRGHSYGGYVAGLTMGLFPGVFRAAIIGAPVTDWRLYDTIYTERYMGLIDQNADGYERSSVITHAPNIEGALFIAHSAMDENVHLQNTMQLVTALTNAGVDAELRIYPLGDHSVAYNAPSFVLLHKAYFNFLERELKRR